MLICLKNCVILVKQKKTVNQILVRNISRVRQISKKNEVFCKGHKIFKKSHSFLTVKIIEILRTSQSAEFMNFMYKVQIFLEGHKILKNFHLTFDWHYIGQK